MWFTEIEDKIVGRFRANGEVLKKYYPNINFTDENETDIAITRFPTVYIEELSGMERGRDLEGTHVNAYMATFQINVIHNDERTAVKRVMRNCMETAKQLQFEIIGTPTYSRSNKTWYGTARIRRVLGASDPI